MSSNSHMIVACIVSLTTGIFLGRFFTSSSSPAKKSQKHKKHNTSSQYTSEASSSKSSPSIETSDLPDIEDDSDFEESEEEDYQVDSTSLNEIPGETRMALIVRSDLKMGKGKAAAQCAHAALGCYRLMLDAGSNSENLTMLKRWERSGQAKIALQASSKEDMDLLFAKAISLNINSYIVHDAGRTQVKAGSATVLGLGPAPKLILDEVTSDLKLF